MCKDHKYVQHLRFKQLTRVEFMLAEIQSLSLIYIRHTDMLEVTSDMVDSIGLCWNHSMIPNY